MDSLGSPTRPKQWFAHWPERAPPVPAHLARSLLSNQTETRRSLAACARETPMSHILPFLAAGLVAAAASCARDAPADEGEALALSAPKAIAGSAAQPAAANQPAADQPIDAGLPPFDGGLPPLPDADLPPPVDDAGLKPLTDAGTTADGSILDDLGTSAASAAAGESATSRAAPRTGRAFNVPGTGSAFPAEAAPPRSAADPPLRLELDAIEAREVRAHQVDAEETGMGPGERLRSLQQRLAELRRQHELDAAVDARLRQADRSARTALRDADRAVERLADSVRRVDER